jgi:ribosomal protein S18 acetylase RimI-like enzyme
VSDVVLRPARPDETEAVGALTVAGYDVEGYLTLPDGTFDDDYAGFLADGASRARDAELMVAVDAGSDTLLGTVTWCPPGSPFRELASEDHQGEIRTLAVSPEARGRGVGSALIDWCLEQARATGLTEIVLSSLPEMRAAHRLYGVRGFVRRTDLDWSPYEGVDLWGFSLDLASATGTVSP